MRFERMARRRSATPCSASLRTPATAQVANRDLDQGVPVARIGSFSVPDEGATIVFAIAVDAGDVVGGRFVAMLAPHRAVPEKRAARIAPDPHAPVVVVPDVVHGARVAGARRPLHPLRGASSIPLHHHRAARATGTFAVGAAYDELRVGQTGLRRSEKRPPLGLAVQPFAPSPLVRDWQSTLLDYSPFSRAQANCLSSGRALYVCCGRRPPTF